MTTARVDAAGQEVVLELSRAQRVADPYAFHGLKPQEYLLRVGQGGVRSASFPWSQRVLEDLEALAQKDPDPAAARRLGEELRRFLDALDWGGYEDDLEQAARQGGALRLVLRSAAAELYSLPWELVTLKDSGQHLADVPGFTLRYEWPSELPPEPRMGAAPEGRVLLAWSEAGGSVPEDRHVEALLKASLEGGFGFEARRDVVPRVSLEALEAALCAASLASRPVTVLHVLCHGAPLEGSAAGHYGLAWNAPGDRGGRQLVDGAALGAVLAPYADTLRMVVLCACHGGDGGRLASYLGSVAQELHRAGIEMVVASRLPMTAGGSVVLARTLYEKLLVDSCSLEKALGAVRRRLRVEARGFDWASLQLYARRRDCADLRPVVLRPYRGLLPFGPKDRRFFFGRSRLEAQLLERVEQAGRGQRPRFQVVAGASGAGKSSVVMAGLVPRLPEAEWDWLKVRPGELVRAGPEAGGARVYPLWELRDRLRQVWTTEPPAQDAEATLVEVLEEARRLRQARPGCQLLVVVDPLEEVFTQLGVFERQALMETLWALSQAPELGCVVMAAVRVDYLGRGREVALDGGTRLDVVLHAEAHRVLVEPLDPKELAEAITQPARHVGLELEPGLVGRLCGDAGREPGALPLLEHALDLLWQRREGNRLTHRAYDQLEGLGGGLTQAAEHLYDSLADDELQQVRRLRAELVALGSKTTPDSRRRVCLEELRPTDAKDRAAFDAVVEKLVNARLLTRGSDADGPEGVWLEPSHEVLVRRWQRIRRWLEQHRQQLLQWRKLQDMAEAWHEHRGDLDGGRSYLATGARLDHARSIQREHAWHMTARVREFLEACEARERRRTRRRLLNTASLSLGMLTLAVLALRGVDPGAVTGSLAAVSSVRRTPEPSRDPDAQTLQPPWRQLPLGQAMLKAGPVKRLRERNLATNLPTLAEVAQGPCTSVSPNRKRDLMLVRALADSVEEDPFETWRVDFDTRDDDEEDCPWEE